MANIVNNDITSGTPQELEMFNQVVRPKRMRNETELSILWSDVKEFVNSLTDEQLKQPLRVCGDEKGGGIFAISFTNDDMINPSGDGMEMKSYYANSEDENDREIAEEEPVVLEKGAIVLELDF